jgi:hypothetical protein
MWVVSANVEVAGSVLKQRFLVMQSSRAAANVRFHKSRALSGLSGPLYSRAPGAFRADENTSFLDFRLAAFGCFGWPGRTIRTSANR